MPKTTPAPAKNPQPPKREPPYTPKPAPARPAPVVEPKKK